MVVVLAHLRFDEELEFCKMTCVVDPNDAVAGVLLEGQVQAEKWIHRVIVGFVGEDFDVYLISLSAVRALSLQVLPRVARVWVGLGGVDPFGTAVRTSSPPTGLHFTYPSSRICSSLIAAVQTREAAAPTLVMCVAPEDALLATPWTDDFYFICPTEEPLAFIKITACTCLLHDGEYPLGSVTAQGQTGFSLKPLQALYTSSTGPGTSGLMAADLHALLTGCRPTRRVEAKTGCKGE